MNETKALLPETEAGRHIDELSRWLDSHPPNQFNGQQRADRQRELERWIAHKDRVDATQAAWLRGRRALLARASDPRNNAWAEIRH